MPIKHPVEGLRSVQDIHLERESVRERVFNLFFVLTFARGLAMRCPHRSILNQQHVIFPIGYNDCCLKTAASNFPAQPSFPFS